MKLTDILKEFELDQPKSGESYEPNYMVTQNLKQIARNANEILNMDEKKLLELMAHHPWAVDHISTSKDDIEEVFNFLKENLSIINDNPENLEHNEDL
jgi:hypothetical protein